MCRQSTSGEAAPWQAGRVDDEPLEHLAGFLNPDAPADPAPYLSGAAGVLTPGIVASALDRLWNPPPPPPPPWGRVRRAAPARDPEWTVRADGYRLIIEDGAIIGLGYEEDPWPWGAPAWLTSHLIADAELRSYTGQSHRCDDGCVCPRCQTPMIYAPRGDDHACQDVTCWYGRGIRAIVGAAGG